MEKLDRIESKIDRIENKLDSHLERISAAEVSIEWIKGHVSYINMGILAIIGAIATYIFTR